jgi:hypothetical protein
VAILPPQYVVSDTPTTVTMTADQTTSATFLISPISGYIGAVDMQCSGLPANTTCSFDPGTVSFQVQTGSNGQPVQPQPQSVQIILTTGQVPPTTVAAFVFPLGGVGLLAFARLRKGKGYANLLMVFGVVLLGVGMLGLQGCGSGAPFTPKGSRVVTVTLTGSPNGTTTVPPNGDGNIVSSFTFTLKVD